MKRNETVVPVKNCLYQKVVKKSLTNDPWILQSLFVISLTFFKVFFTSSFFV